MDISSHSIYLTPQYVKSHPNISTISSHKKSSRNKIIMVFKRLLNALQSTLKFPYVDFNSSTQSLKDFPVKMCINLPEELSSPDIRALKTLDFDTYIDQQTVLPSGQKTMLKAIINKLLPKKIKQDREGFLYAYSTLLQSFVEDIDPEVFCEHNLARALK